MVAIMISSALLAAIIGNIALFQAGNVIEKSALDLLQTKSESYSNEFSRITERVEGVLDTYTTAITVSIDMERTIKEKDAYIESYQNEVLLPLTKEIAKNTSGILGIYFDIDPSITPGLKDEDSVYGAWFLDRNLSGEISRELLEKKKHFTIDNELMFWWYYNPILKGAGVWSKPYKDIYTGYHMISYNKPVYMNGELLGVAGVDIVFEDMMKMIKSVRIGETGYAYLLDNDLDLIVHPEMEKNLKWDRRNLKDLDKKQYLELADTISKQESGVADIGQGYSKKVAGFSHMSNGYLIVIEVNSNEIMEQLNRVRSIIDAIMLVGILIAALVAYSLGKFISKPLDRLGKMIKRMMHFDFSSEINDMKLVDGSSDSGVMIVELTQLRKLVQNSITMIRNNVSTSQMLNEKMEKHLMRMDSLIEKIQYMEGSDRCSDELKIELEQLSVHMEEIKKILKDLNDENKKNSNITELYKTD